jgi:radical SAM family uncharacterized protein/radical SAM-linked protein
MSCHAPGLSETAPASELDAGGERRPQSEVLSERDLLAVQKPAQYLGGERNSVKKNDNEVDVHIALCFPDTYEVGMSHLGLQILYDILNREQKTWAERMYMPLDDMEQLLRQRHLPLCSLESRRPFKEFDIVGFSLQYELCGTNILAMLDLGGVAFYSAERADDDPLIIGGGPYSYHPEAIAPFFDAFFLGDAEEAILDVTRAVREIKQDGPYSRKKLLKRLGEIEGIYVPSQFAPEVDSEGRFRGMQALNPDRPQIVRRLLPTMEGAPYPKKPLVPNIQTVHNRLSVEVMRGCVRGCRFCQAGYLYRPQRERSPEEIVEMIGTALPESGFEELSLLSLSTADYCSIVPLLKTLMDRYAADDKLAISFPSTRVDALRPEVLEQVQRVRRTGFTVAPEGGSQRLRDVINKGVSDEQILETCSNVFKMGWGGIKLYFMLGLPTETDDDLNGIISLAERVRALPEARGKEITVSVSTFVPKPHTPFQWAEQITAGETIRRQRLLAEGLRRAKVNFRYHESFSSFLEGVFCRAGRELAPAVVRAYQLGCRLDAWQDHLKEDLWIQAFADCGIQPENYLRERDPLSPLPWDHLSCGIPKSYFLKEWQRALRDRPTPDCLTKSCSICGACDYDQHRNILWPRGETEQLFAEHTVKTPISLSPPAEVARMRIRYSKDGCARYLGHLELVSIFHRAARRAEIPLSFSQGFHPMPRLAFGPPLQLGLGSQAEFVDAFLTVEMQPEDLLARFNAALPEGISVCEVRPIAHATPSIHETLSSHRFRLRWIQAPRGLLGTMTQEEEHQATWENFLAAAEQAVVERQTDAGGRGARRRNPAPDRSKRFPLREFVSNYCPGRNQSGDYDSLEFSLRVDNTRACPKPTEIVTALSELHIGEYYLEKVSAEFGMTAAERLRQAATEAGAQPTATL